MYKVARFFQQRDRGWLRGRQTTGGLVPTELTQATRLGLQDPGRVEVASLPPAGDY